MAASTDVRRRAENLAADTFRELWTLAAECASVIREIAPQKRRPWLQDVVDELYEAQRGLCSLCQHEMSRAELTVDHRIPFVYGGGNERSNIQLAHLNCNQRKKVVVDPRDLIRYLEDRYMNRPPR